MTQAWEATELDVLRAESDEALHLLSAARGILGCEEPMTKLIPDAECVRQLAINFRGALSLLVEACETGRDVTLRVGEARAVLNGQSYEPAEPSSEEPKP